MSIMMGGVLDTVHHWSWVSMTPPPMVSGVNYFRFNLVMKKPEVENLATQSL
jgi:hypothetical protein